MAKEAGFPATIIIDDSGGVARTISNDITNWNMDQPQNLQDVTGQDSSAMERLGLLRDFTVSCTTVFNDAANTEHDVFKNLANARTWSTAVSGQTLAPEVLISSAALTRAADGSLTRAITASLQDGTVPTWA